MKKVEPQTLGQRIRYLRGDMTQAEFAHVLHIKQAMVSRYEADKETPSPKVLLRIGQFARRSLEWLLTGEDLLTKPGGDEEVKRIANGKASKKMTKKELVDIACGYLRDARLAEIEDFVKMIKTLATDLESMQKVLEFYRYMQYEKK